MEKIGKEVIKYGKSAHDNSYKIYLFHWYIILQYDKLNAL